MKTFNKNIILLALLLVVIILPLVINSDAEYGGADGEAEGIIAETSPKYEPWFNAIWEPPSGEIESLLFVTQAALGAGIIGYYFGYMKGKRKSADNR